MDIKKALRTLQVEFPFLLEWKFQTMRRLRSALNLPFERDFAAIPLLSPPPDALFLDVGANRGQSTDAILMMVPGARVQLFEPNHQLFVRLQGIFASLPHVVQHNFGLGDEKTEAVLHVPFYKQWMFDGLASFDEHEARDWLDGRMYFFKSSHVRVEKSICRVQRLDDMALRPFFVKIDVQGFELNVLKGGRQTLIEHKPVLLIEAPSPAIIEFLAALGYEPYAFDAGRFHRGRRGRLNTFFLTPDKAAAIAASARPAVAAG
ncbi:MAG: FkbM family methyltransferase [Burkholderiaceae bacterium]|nr:FkbM family methyltransferase [Burkholderiaceae bacterium]